MHQTVFLLLFTSIVFSQKSEERFLLFDAEKAVVEGNLKLAKDIYLKALAVDSLNTTLLYNLAATEINLGEIDSACEHLYRNYRLGDRESLTLIREFCPKVTDGKVLSRTLLDIPERFIYQNQESQLIENSDLNPEYKSILVKEIKKSKLLRGKIKGKLVVVFSIGRLGNFDGRIIRLNVDKENEEVVRMEVLRIFRQIVTYLPAEVDGKPVEVWEKLMLPLNFGD